MVVNPDYDARRGPKTICNYGWTRKYNYGGKGSASQIEGVGNGTYRNNRSSEAISLDCLEPEVLVNNYLQHRQEIPVHLKTAKLHELIEKELVKLHAEALAEDKERKARAA